METYRTNMPPKIIKYFRPWQKERSLLSTIVCHSLPSFWVLLPSSNHPSWPGDFLKLSLFLMHFSSHSFASCLVCRLHYWREGTPNLVIVYDTTLRPHREETRRCIASHWCWGRSYIATWSHSGAILGLISFLYKSPKRNSLILALTFHPQIALLKPSFQFQLVGAFQVPGSPLVQAALSTATSPTPSITLSNPFTPLFIRHGRIISQILTSY